MTTPIFDEYLQRSLDSLKDFQRATVKVVYDNLFVNGQRRMLVADEVGLGKTVVARGVIAQRIVEKIQSGDKTPLKVTYICSNQVIAHENVGKLDIYPNQQSHDQFASRLTYLSFEPEGGDKGLLRLNTLTPATSFERGSSTGQQNERRILYSLLMNDEELRGQSKAVSAMLRAGVTLAASDWYRQLEGERDNPCGHKLRSCCHTRFLKAIRRKRIEYSGGQLFEQLGRKKDISLYNATLAFTKLVSLQNLRQYREGCDHLVRELKDALSEVCVDYIDADIYILDEFQRFKELVDKDCESDAAEIAKKIFGKEKARILLLSATPFKAYTNDSSLESGEEHYKEFSTILRFLFDCDQEALLSYETHRQALFKQLLELKSQPEEIDSTHRDAVQQVLRRVICRTERLCVSDDFNAMTVDKSQTKPLQLTAGDINNFVATDSVVRFMNKTDANPNHQLHPPIEFCKSAPYPLSFLDDYKIKFHIRARKHESELIKKLKDHSGAWIDHRFVNRYKLDFRGRSGGATNAKFNQVLQETLGGLDGNGEKLLWIPPSLPCYPLTGEFTDRTGFSKTLIFSAWLMVPRMLSSLISYEVERKTIGNPGSVESQETPERKYFHSKTEKRHPIPQLVFSQKRSEAGESSGNMTNFALIYPSPTLADAFSPDKTLLSSSTLPEIRETLTTKFNQLIEDSELHRFSTSKGESDKWYWAAPLLLDRRTPSMHSNVKNWLDKSTSKHGTAFFDLEKAEGSSKRKHFAEFANCFNDPSSAGLGPLPEDLGQWLAEMSIASPAVVALRCGFKQFDSDYQEQLGFAFDVASEFISMFNKPESIAAVRLSTNRLPYWQRVLKYCADGCLQSVMEEFFHVLETDCPTLSEMLTRIVASMNLGTASIKVDDLKSFLDDRRKNMRCHYAVDLGNQRMETDDGKKRIKGIRHNFNSPFRPFVLATTSIGQEGLDFHTYCRKIVHWNLPSNPIDLEQREGRINRFKGLVTRQQIARKYRCKLDCDSLEETNAWDALFKIADAEERQGTGKCELIPYWHVKADIFQIERIIPFYPFSRDRAKLSILLKTLALYRLTFGQPRQVELVDHLLTNIPESRIAEIRSKLMIDLSPILYQRPQNRA